MDLSHGLLATGGIAAVLAAGWNQVKTVSRYLSSFVLVSASLDGPISEAVGWHLRLNYKPLPSGLLHYVGLFLQVRDKPQTVLVPFRATSRNAIWLRGWQLVISSGPNHGLKLLSVRGMIDFDRLVSEALDQQSDLRFNAWGPAKSSRFHIVRVLGSEKGSFALGSRGNNGEIGVKGSQEPLGRAPTSLNADAGFDIHLSIDTSFKYAREDYCLDRTADPFEALYFPPEVMRYVEQAQQWFDLRDWYVERSIPWRRGWLLHGPAGTGKSSMAKAIGMKLGIPVYQFFLSTLSDQEFTREWSRMETPCIALFEDFDTIFDRRVSLTEHKSLTFDCVLNEISGVSSISGVFLMVTTNKLDSIDEAMGISRRDDGISTRPGRIDSVIHVGLITAENRYRMARRILRDWPEDIPGLVGRGEGVSPIQFQEMCVQLAFERLNESPPARLRLIA